MTRRCRKIRKKRGYGDTKRVGRIILEVILCVHNMKPETWAQCCACLLPMSSVLAYWKILLFWLTVNINRGKLYPLECSYFQTRCLRFCKKHSFVAVTNLFQTYCTEPRPIYSCISIDIQHTEKIFRHNLSGTIRSIFYSTNQFHARRVFCEKIVVLFFASYEVGRFYILPIWTESKFLPQICCYPLILNLIKICWTVSLINNMDGWTGGWINRHGLSITGSIYELRTKNV